MSSVFNIAGSRIRLIWTAVVLNDDRNHQTTTAVVSERQAV